jgi:hypothetical protein
MAATESAFDIITRQLADPHAQWSLGTFGAVAEFWRDPDEPAEIETGERMMSVVTPRGGIRLDARDGLRPLAFETVTTHAWSQRVAFCLPEARAAMSRRAVLTELGPDTQALRAQDRGAILFDLGLGVLQADCCIRTAEAELIAALRAGLGRAVFDPANPVMGAVLQAGPHRVFITRCGRAEVYQPIPLPGGKSPAGPHTHVLPKLLAHRRTHAASEPIPAGWVSCAYLYPAHPLRDGDGRAIPFDAGRHMAFQRLLARHGDIELVRLKRNVVKALNAGAGPEAIAMPDDRFARAAIRIALRQLKTSDGTSAGLSAWFAAYDSRPMPEDEAEELSAS